MSTAWLPALQAVADGWAQAMGRAAVQGGLAVLLAWAVCRLMPSLPGAARCWLWRLVYLRLLLALCWPHALELPLLPAPPPAPVAYIAPLAVGPDDPVAIRTLPAFERTPTTPAATVAPIPPPTEAVPSWALWLAGLWLVGVAWCVAQIARQCRRAARLRAQSACLEDERILERWESLCERAGIRRVPELRCLEGLDGPMLLGGVRPLVALPEELLRDWPPEQLELALAHELAHVKRADLFWSWLPALAHVGFYFHPLLWLAGREWRLAQELACDALALRLARSPAGEYAAMLVRLAHRRSYSPTPAMAGALWAASESPDCLRRRLQAMKNSETHSRRRAALFGGAVIVLAGVLLVPFRVVAQSPAAEARNGAELAAQAGDLTLKHAAEASTPDDSRPISLEMTDSPLSQVIQAIKDKSNARIVFDEPDGKLESRRIKFLSIRKKTVQRTLSVVCKSVGAYFRRDQEGTYHLSARPYEETSAKTAGRAESELTPEPQERVTINVRGLLEQARRATLEEDRAQSNGQQADAERQAREETESGEPAAGQEELERQHSRNDMLRKKLAEVEERLSRLRQDFTPRSPEVQAVQKSRDFLAAELEKQEAELRRSMSEVSVEEARRARQDRREDLSRQRNVDRSRREQLRAAEVARQAVQQAMRQAKRQAERAQLDAQRAALEARLRAMDADRSRLRQDYLPESERVRAAEAAREAVQQALQERMAQLEAAQQALKEADESRALQRERALRGDRLGRTRLDRQREAGRKRERGLLPREFDADSNRWSAGAESEGNLRRELDALSPAQREALVRKLQRIPEQVERSFREAQRSLDASGKRLDEPQRRRLLDELKRLQERIREELSRTLGREVPDEPAEKAVR